MAESGDLLVYWFRDLRFFWIVNLGIFFFTRLVMCFAGYVYYVVLFIFYFWV